MKKIIKKKKSTGHKVKKVSGPFLKGPFVNIWGEPSIHPEAQIGAFVEIGDKPDCGTVIGKCNIQAKVFIPPGTRIEDDVFIGPNVVLTNDKKPPSTLCQGVIIKKGAIIGANSTIIAGVTIGENAFIGAHSLVTKDIPASEIWYGSPATSRGYRRN